MIMESPFHSVSLDTITGELRNRFYDECETDTKLLLYFRGSGSIDVEPSWNISLRHFEYKEPTYGSLTIKNAPPQMYITPSHLESRHMNRSRLKVILRQRDRPVNDSGVYEPIYIVLDKMVTYRVFMDVVNRALTLFFPVGKTYHTSWLYGFVIDLYKMFQYLHVNKYYIDTDNISILIGKSLVTEESIRIYLSINRTHFIPNIIP